MASIKSMAALFSAFDRQKYQKLIPQHITDLLTIPKDDLSKLESEGFTVSIKGRPCHSIGVDEAHEMCIRVHESHCTFLTSEGRGSKKN